MIVVGVALALGTLVCLATWAVAQLWQSVVLGVTALQLIVQCRDPEVVQRHVERLVVEADLQGRRALAVSAGVGAVVALAAAALATRLLLDAARLPTSLP